MSGFRWPGRRWTRVLSALPPGRRRWAVVALIGWWLSPLTAWNDAFTNIPLSIATVYLLKALGAEIDAGSAAVVVYVVTNVVGLLLLWIGMGKVTSGRSAGPRPWSPLRLAVRTVLYAVLVYFSVQGIEKMIGDVTA
jgi:hypothetical protein